MKPRRSNQRCYALTLVEVLVVLFLLMILIAMLLPALARPKRGSHINCVNNLKQVGLAYRIWAGDNNDKYPMEVSATNGGAMELAAAGNAVAAFQVMSNELSTPRVLLCPLDKEHSRATNFNSCFTAKNVSYFIGLDANSSFPNSILGGDNNLERGGRPISPGVHELTTNTMYFWSASRHRRSGNVVLADGSVQSLANSNLVNRFNQTGLATNRLAIP
ncbi:MAG TPA: prepilin-type N-terminal cleavage/methylation domain-containing protein [bacterium]|jgi:prepilin-type processing-associated H-X9-DG protein|nr:prepilin-type N-terminal cleavage/methylation domain-containing protein [bacterium]